MIGDRLEFRISEKALFKMIKYSSVVKHSGTMTELTAEPASLATVSSSLMTDGGISSVTTFGAFWRFPISSLMTFTSAAIVFVTISS